MEYIRPDMVFGPGERQLNEAFLDAEKNPTKIPIKVSNKELKAEVDRILKNLKRNKNG